MSVCRLDERNDSTTPFFLLFWDLWGLSRNSASRLSTGDGTQELLGGAEVPGSWMSFQRVRKACSKNLHLKYARRVTRALERSTSVEWSSRDRRRESQQHERR